MSRRLFIDGSEGTTGLEIRDRLAGREDFALVEIDERYRKDPMARRDAFAAADFAILCLPDQAAREAMALAEDTRIRVIDASTAHRTAPGWVYGFAELAAGQRERIAEADFVANPGCYAVAFVALVRPLVDAGLIAPDEPLTVHAVSGYSGGGRTMIAAFEGGDASAFRTYGLSLDHKHLPEMQRLSGLTQPPLFAPAVVDLYRGMLVEIPLPPGTLAGGAGAAELREAYRAHYADSRTVCALAAEESSEIGQLGIERCAGSDRIDLMVFGNEPTGQIRLCAALDNLGKGAAGSAVQNLNLMAGLEETAGLRL